jgi:hypothetical protein
VRRCDSGWRAWLASGSAHGTNKAGACGSVFDIARDPPQITGTNARWSTRKRVRTLLREFSLSSVEIADETA